MDFGGIEERKEDKKRKKEGIKEKRGQFEKETPQSLQASL